MAIYREAKTCGYRRDSHNQQSNRLKIEASVLYQQHPRRQWSQCTPVRV